jgi:hypothetical protein
LTAKEFALAVFAGIDYWQFQSDEFDSLSGYDYGQ